MDQQHQTDQTPQYQGLSLTKTLATIAILAAITGAIIFWMIANKPEAERGKPPQSIISVEAIHPQISDYPIKINTNGTVTAQTRGNLVAQVSGEIIEVADNFANGGSFKQGDILLKIDGRDFKTAMQAAQANLAQAKLTLSQEQASAEQAKRDWKRLGFTGEPNDLVLRKPQLNAAVNQRDSAQSAFDKARLDFARTRIKAPYDGFVIQKNVALGQFVSTGSILGEIFSTDGLEVALPLNQEQFAQLSIQDNPPVTLQSQLAGTLHTWSAQIIRADSVFDPTTRQINVIAKINNPISDQGSELKIGQYINAEIAGNIAQQAMVIPNQAIREGSYVFIFDDGVLRRQPLKITWQDKENAIIKGISPDQLVVTTAVGSSLNGSQARLVGNHGNNNQSAAPTKPAKQTSQDNAAKQ